MTDALGMLSNVDLSGVTGYIHYTYDNSITIIPSIIIAFVSVIAVAVILGILLMAVRRVLPESKVYRELLVDMYVVGMIKKFSKEDSIELQEELRDFSKMMKKTRLNGKYLDSVIEENLKEKITDKFEKELEEKSKK